MLLYQLLWNEDIIEVTIRHPRKTLWTWAMTE